MTKLFPFTCQSKGASVTHTVVSIINITYYPEGQQVLKLFYNTGGPYILNHSLKLSNFSVSLT
jgi:hypothetical protein